MSFPHFLENQQGEIWQEKKQQIQNLLDLLESLETDPAEFVSEVVRILCYPAELLHEIHIVDTPGTNAVLRHHEAIAQDFVPRSDMGIFVTSADRP